MTQVKDKTNHQLNMVLAELMGYTVDKGRPGRVLKGNMSSMPTDYCNDPAASLEVEKVAIEHDFDAYVQNLAIVKWGEPDEDVEDTAVWNKTMRYSIAELLTASPRERAEAAYITLHQSKGDK